MKKPKLHWNGRSDQVEAGKPYFIKPSKDGAWEEWEECCDCGLVHLVRYKAVGNKLQVTVWVDKAHTKETRRKRKVMNSCD